MWVARPYPYAYVVILDRWRNTREEEVFGESLAGDAQITLVSVSPSSVTWAPGADREIATGNATYNRETVLSGIPALAVFLNSETPCLFFYSDRRITWSGWE